MCVCTFPDFPHTIYLTDFFVQDAYRTRTGRVQYAYSMRTVRVLYVYQTYNGSWVHHSENWLPLCTIFFLYNILSKTFTAAIDFREAMERVQRRRDMDSPSVSNPWWRPDDCPDCEWRSFMIITLLYWFPLSNCSPGFKDYCVTPGNAIHSHLKQQMSRKWSSFMNE